MRAHSEKHVGVSRSELSQALATSNASADWMSPSAVEKLLRDDQNRWHLRCSAARHQLVFKDNFQEVLGGKADLPFPGKGFIHRIDLFLPFYPTSLGPHLPSVFAVMNFSALRLVDSFLNHI